MDTPSAIQLLGGLGKLAGELASAKSTADRQALLIEFQKGMIEAHTRISTLQSENALIAQEKRDLEQQIVAFEQWNSEKARYAMTDIGNGGIVYAIKQSEAGSDPAHYICTACYHQGKKSILNAGKSDGWVQLVCPRCNSAVPTGNRGYPTPKYA